MSELLYRGTLKGPLLTSTNSAKTDAWAGVTAIASGTATVVISTTAVKSDSLFQIALQSLTDQASGVGRCVEVRTIVDGGYFILGFADGKTQPRDVNAHWMIFNVR